MIEQDQLQTIIPQIRLYKESLKKEPRWVGAKFPPKDGFSESVWNHIETCLVRSYDLEGLPSLNREINFGIVRDMIYLHDGPEAFVHDLASGSETAKEKVARHKRKESLVFVLCILPRIPDKKLREVARKRYFDFKNKDTKEALLAQIIDKVDGNSTAAIHCYNPSFYGLCSPTPDMKRSVSHYLGMVCDLTAKLGGFLSRAAGGELYRYVAIESMLYQQIGYSDEVETALRILGYQQTALRL